MGGGHAVHTRPDLAGRVHGRAIRAQHRPDHGFNPSIASPRHVFDGTCGCLLAKLYGPSRARRIGTEHEKLGFNLKDNSRMSYEQIAQVLRKLESRFGWQPIIEEGNIIGVLMDGQSVTLEPGGQFELSGAPVDTIHKTCAEVNSHLYQVRVGLCARGEGLGSRAQAQRLPPSPDPWRGGREARGREGGTGGGEWQLAGGIDARQHR